MGNQPVEIFLPEAGLLHGIDNQAAQRVDREPEHLVALHVQVVILVTVLAADRVLQGKERAVGSVARDLGKQDAGLLVGLQDSSARTVAEQHDG